MHKLLARQIKRVLGVEAQQLDGVLQQLRELSQTPQAAPDVALVLNSLGLLLQRVDEAYQQNDRDLDLKTRSLELSSVELTESNARLRAELDSRTRAIDSLRTTAMGLMEFVDFDQPALIDDNLESLSALMSTLVKQREESQKDLHAALADLAHQKFALDQHAIVSTTDVRGNIVYANDKFVEISGYSRAELLNRNHRILKSGAHDDAFFAAMWRTIAQGNVWHGEICNRNKQGKNYWVNATIVPLRDDAGKPSHYIAIRTDITERKRMEATIQAAEARLRRITNTVPGVVFQWHVGVDSIRYTFLSDRVQDIRGISASQATANPNLIANQIVEEDRERVREGIYAAARARTGWQGEYRARLPDGSLHWIRTEINPEPDLAADGATVFTGIWQDVTQLKEADARLREVTENIPVAVFQYFVGSDGRLRISFISHAIEIMCGARPEDLVADGSQMLLHVHPDDAAWVADTLARAHVGKAPWSMDFRMVNSATQAMVWVHGESQPRELASASIAWNGYLTDVTASKNISVELQKAKDDAEAANRAKSDFLANMSHEIRTPMNGVMGMADLLLDTALDGEQAEYVGIVKSSADALLRVINDILDFSKIEAGKLLIEHIPFHLARSIDETLKTLAQRAHDKGLELVCKLSDDVPLAILGDPGRMRQILVNIVGNAVKFTDRGEIVLSVSREAGSRDGVVLHFAVSDSGIGIPKEKLGSIFEAFAQEDSSTTRKYGGTGLGLTICARLVEALGGRIWVESDVGKGSVFHFTMRVDPDPDIARAEDPAVPATLKGLRLLVVDDNAVNRDVLSHVLRSKGAHVHALGSGQEALNWLAAGSANGGSACDLVLLDAQMPQMDGYALSRAIAATPGSAAIPRVMLSSSGLKSDVQRSGESGIAAYLSKPVAREELMQVLSRVLKLDSQRGLAQAAQHSVQEQSRSLNVLLVEDHAINQKLAVALLERWGHRVTVADNGQLALDQLERQKFDVVLMDMMMPVMDGLEATRAIRSRETGRRTPIIAMTANAMEADRDRCIEAGMDDYLSKPIKAQELQAMLARYADAMPVPAAPATVAIAPAAAAFDYAAALAAADQEIVGIIAEAFVEQWPVDLEKIRKALARGDCKVVLHTSHALKGTLSMFGARPASELAARIEAAAAREDQTSIAQWLTPLEVQVEPLLAAIQACLAPGP